MCFLLSLTSGMASGWVRQVRCSFTTVQLSIWSVDTTCFVSHWTWRLLVTGTLMIKATINSFVQFWCPYEISTICWECDYFNVHWYIEWFFYFKLLQCITVPVSLHPHQHLIKMLSIFMVCSSVSSLVCFPSMVETSRLNEKISVPKSIQKRIVWL